MGKDIESYKAVFVQFCGKNEVILIEGLPHKLSIGSLVNSVLTLEERFFIDAELVLDNISHALETGTQEQILSAVQRLQHLPGAAFLKELCYYLPAYETYMKLYKDIRTTGLSRQEQREIIELVRKKHVEAPDNQDSSIETGLTDQEQSRLTELEQTLHTETEKPEYEHWWDWIKLLNGSRNISSGDMGSLKAPEDFLRVAKQYLGNLHAAIREIRKIKAQLDTALIARIKQYRNELLFPIVFADRLPLHMAQELFPAFPTQGGAKHENYAATSISQLIALELDQIEALNIAIKKCALCGRIFFPRSAKALYCQEPNGNYKGKPCCEIGPTLAYKEKVRSSTVWARYKKHCKAYDEWARLVEQKKYFTELKDETEMTEVRDEIARIQADWKRRAKDAISKFDSGDWDEDTAVQALQLPAINARSPKLQEWRDCLRKE